MKLDPFVQKVIESKGDDVTLRQIIGKTVEEHRLNGVADPAILKKLRVKIHPDRISGETDKAIADKATRILTQHLHQVEPTIDTTTSPEEAALLAKLQRKSKQASSHASDLQVAFNQTKYDLKEVTTVCSKANAAGHFKERKPQEELAELIIQWSSKHSTSDDDLVTLLTLVRGAEKERLTERLVKHLDSTGKNQSLLYLYANSPNAASKLKEKIISKCKIELKKPREQRDNNFLIKARAILKSSVEADIDKVEAIDNETVNQEGIEIIRRAVIAKQTPELNALKYKFTFYSGDIEARQNRAYMRLINLCLNHDIFEPLIKYPGCFLGNHRIYLRDNDKYIALEEKGRHRTVKAYNPHLQAAVLKQAEKDVDILIPSETDHTMNPSVIKILVQQDLLEESTLQRLKDLLTQRYSRLMPELFKLIKTDPKRAENIFKWTFDTKMLSEADAEKYNLEFYLELLRMQQYETAIRFTGIGKNDEHYNCFTGLNLDKIPSKDKAALAQEAKKAITLSKSTKEQEYFIRLEAILNV